MAKRVVLLVVAPGPAPAPWLLCPCLIRDLGPPMPEPTGGGSREFLASANQSLAELEEATGKPV